MHRLWLSLLLLGCAEPRHDLVVDLNTDLRPGLDFASVRTRVLEAPTPARTGGSELYAASSSDDFVTPPGRRVAELRGYPPGGYLIVLELLDGRSAIVATRNVRVDLQRSRVVSLIITSDCFGVVCPAPSDEAERTECLGGRCVAPECTAEDADRCGPVGCRADDECAASVACAGGVCVASECFVAPDDGQCPEPDTYCDVTRGCQARPASAPDAGPARDGGPPRLDAGPSCTPAACDDSDPCTEERCVSGACVSVPRCGPSEYCRLGECAPAPTLELETPEPGGCVDIGVPHPSGSDFTFRRTVTGRPNASGQQRNEQLSCAAALEPAETFTLDASGRDQYTYYSGALAECWDGIYGRWRVDVEVDGVASNAREVVYYNSGCANVRTCAAARTFCSPCRGCDLDRGYCFGGTTCAPDPTLSIVTSEGGGCVDLGVPHSSPPALRFTITGRPRATSTQYNRQVSCGAAEVPAEVRSLDGSGRATDASAPTGAAPCDNPVHGRWDVEVEVDGERSNTVEVVYFNSACAGFSTCAQARSYCPP